MTFLLDTNICSAHMRRPARLAHRFVQHVGQLAMPTIVLGELYAGAFRHSDPTRLVGLIEALQTENDVLDFDSRCAKTFGQLRGESLRLGSMTSTVDLMIASVAVTHNLTLVTHNVRDFERVPDLRVVDWLST